MADAAEWRGKSQDELVDALQKLKKEQFNLRFQKANGQLENTNRPREVRRDIACILTLMGERMRHPEMAAATAIRTPKTSAPKAEKTEEARPAKKPAKRAVKKR